MSVSSNPAAEAASQRQSPDIQQRVALLGSLMPLLLRFQSQGMPSQGFQSQGFPSQGLEPPFQAGQGNFMAPNFMTPNFLAPNPAIDHQAAVNLVGDITADS